MNQNEVLKAAKESYKKKKNEETEKECYSLKNITDEDFVLRGKEENSENGVDPKEQWYNQRFRQLKEMLKAFDVLEEFNSIKPKGSEYSLSKRNKDFILMLFREYSGKFEHLKRGEVAATDGAYLLEVYAGILDIFYDANASDSLIESVMLKLWNRLNIPQRNMDAVMDSVCDECKRMIKKNVDSVSMGMGVREKLFWQTAFRYAFYDFIYRWDSFYEKIEEIRQEEVLKKAELEAACVSPEWEECAEIEFVLSTEIKAALDNDHELQQLNAKRDELLGVGKSRRPLIRNVEKQFDECTYKLVKRMKEVELEVIRRYKPDFIYPKGWDDLPPVDFEFMSLKQLLETAMANEQEQHLLFPISSIEDLINRMNKYFP
ncbi:MAG: hypothetical protein K2M82_07675 [Lachnospiraceae bacterium]|nr:hypothetical protein [Lachnospiraceae bacterium]